MKNLYVFAVAGLLLASCSDTARKQKAVLSDLLKAHDQVMSDDDTVQLRSAQLDTLLKRRPELKAQITPITAALDTAHDHMMAWMNAFKTEYTQQPSKEGLIYLTSEKKRLFAVDAQLTAAADDAEQYLSEIKK